MLFNYARGDLGMRLKPITGFVMLILLFGVAAFALQNSVLAQTSSDSNNDNNKSAEETEKTKQESETTTQDATRSICNQDDREHAKKEIAALEQRYGELKTKFYQEWQALHESGEYDGPWEKYAQEHFLNSPELAEMKNVREKYSEFFRHCNDARETGPYPVHPNDIREAKPYHVSPNDSHRTICNPDDYSHAKKELAGLEQRYGEFKTKHYNEWQKLHASGQYAQSWEDYAKEHFMNSPDMAEARNTHEKYSKFVRHCNGMMEGKPYPASPTNVPRIACNQDDYVHAKKELAGLEQRYGELKTKFYQEWRALHESGEYDGPWEKYAQEHFLNSPELADLNHMREKYHQFMMHCTNAQETTAGQANNVEEETTSEDDQSDELDDETESDDDQTDDADDEIEAEDDLTDELDDETTSDEDLEDLLGDVESVTAVPTWMKDDAGWWAHNQVDDSDFASSIEYLGAQKIMRLSDQPVSDSAPSIPAWVKAIAAWWAEGKIPDQDFVNAMQFLVDHGVIKV